MKPYIICHMMTSIDGRIDCAMLEKLDGGDEYYQSLSALYADATITGKVTAELEIALKGKFNAQSTALGKVAFSCKKECNNYEIFLDSKGSLLWEDDEKYNKHHIIIVSEQVDMEYLRYLDSKNISWVACGKDKVDLVQACEILNKEFNIKRLAVVGGTIVNSAFLQAGLIDEISLLIGLGIDGRSSFPPVFNGFDDNAEPILLKLKNATTYQNGAVCLQYFVQK